MFKLSSRSLRPTQANNEGGRLTSGIVGDSDLFTEMKSVVSISLAQWSVRMYLISQEPPGLGQSPIDCVLPPWAPDSIMQLQ